MKFYAICSLATNLHKTFYIIFVPPSNMSLIKSKDTSIEVTFRKALWKAGFRYRKNYKKLPGKPDIALTKQKIAIFCDGDFWHGKQSLLLDSKN
jgi:DNA mismatch endonuclease (patch repair protein)